jgi:hypothetical protein
MVVIEFDYHSTRLNEEAMLSWFPGLFFLRRVDGDQLVKNHNRHISKYFHENAETETIRDQLRNLFARFASLECAHTDWLYGSLTHNMRRTIYDRRKHLGRKECRQQFVVFACLAGYVPSQRLAEVLANFLSKEIHSVLGLVQLYRLREWGFAAHELYGLVFEPIHLQLASHLARPGPAVGHGWPLPSFYDPREELGRKAIADALRGLAADHHKGRRQNRRLRPHGSGFSSNCRLLKWTHGSDESEDWRTDSRQVVFSSASQRVPRSWRCYALSRL